MTLLLVEQGVRTDGTWEDWLRFFLKGVIEVAASTAETTRGIVEMIERLGILREVTGKSRGKTYVYGEYMDILNEGTEL